MYDHFGPEKIPAHIYSSYWQMITTWKARNPPTFPVFLVFSQILPFGVLLTCVGIHPPLGVCLHCLGDMAAKWLNSVDVDFGVQFEIEYGAVHGFVRSLKVEPQDLLGLVAVLDREIRSLELVYDRGIHLKFLPQHSGIVRTELKGKNLM
ncbi:hypothetical protein OUZ56_024212 [Daphnia magna]|uniref:Uncharacterized protein n=1 Tax=Daphnia magna TaxID=35525 RepID=A0ABR0B0C3_9CRUS|nr:hypothetical protein OUZ56_024212 [Daphnia magna]